jgi:hypothetical protein
LQVRVFHLSELHECECLGYDLQRDYLAMP